MDKIADQSVAEIERRIRKIYSQAAAEITEDMDKYLQKFRKKDAMLRAKVLKGEITEDEYRRWKQGQVFAGDRWKARQRKASGTLLMANQKANAIVEGKRLEVFQDGANYQAYEFERDTGIGIDFDLLNEDAVERLIRDEPELLPRRELDKDKDMGWNQRIIANAVTQSILQGESMEEAARRIGRDTGITNEKAMMRYARTAVNGAENAGSLQGLREIQAMGIHVMKQWVATLDSKTRDAHQDLDGQVAELDESFESQLGPIDYPGDPSAEPGNVYNCRCTIKAYYPGYADMIGAERQRRAYEDPHSRESVVVGNMTYKEWKAAKQASEPSAGRSASLSGSTNTDGTRMPQKKPEGKQHYQGETLSMHDEAQEWADDNLAQRIQDFREGWANVSSQIEAINSFEAEIPQYLQIITEAIEREDFSSITSSDAIIHILEDGRFKTQIETGESHGYRDIRLRKRVADDMFAYGEHIDIPDTAYEVYGMLGNAPRGNMYGNCKIVLKKGNMMSRTTFTVGDSLELRQTGADPFASFVDDPRITSIGTDIFSTSIPNAPDRLKEIRLDFESIKKHGYTASGGYIELQYHGGVTTDDIDYIVIPKADINAKKIYELAKERGIKIKWRS